MEVISAAQFKQAVELANALRGALGEKQIRKLPKGTPKAPRRCILARAFNFDCQVNRYRSTSNEWWYVTFRKDKVADLQALKDWADNAGLTMRRDNEVAVSYYLPEEIGAIGAAFDDGLLTEYHAST